MKGFNDFGRLRSWAAYVAILGALLIGGIAGSVAAGPSQIPPLAPAERDTAASELPLTGTFNPVVQKVVPAVVSITAERTVRTSGMESPFDFGPFGDLFGGPDAPPQERRARGSGSGVIVTADGYILTNHHVIDSAEAIEIHLDDGRDLNAEVVGSDSRTDIAVLKVDATGLPFVTFGNSDNVLVGDIVLAVGSPFGLSLRQTVTMGIVGGTGRGSLGIEDYEDFIQTDAAINPGNSGGALVNTKGELIGINTAILSRSGGNQGIGFAVPVNMAHRVMTQLIENGRVSRGYIGVNIQDATKELAEQFGVPQGRGALVSNVSPDSPAANAGLRKGDVITAVDGQAVTDARDLSLHIAGENPGTTVNLAVWRGREEVKVPVTLGEFPEDDQMAAAPQGAESSALRGLAVDDLTPAVARQLQLPAGTKGVVVTRVVPGSAAEEAGLGRGDVIEEVAQKPVASVAEFQAAVREADGGSVLLLVNRGGGSRFVVVETRGN